MGMLRVDWTPPAPGGLEDDSSAPDPDSDCFASVVEPSSFAIGTAADGAPPEPPARPRGVSLNWKVMFWFCSNQRDFGLGCSYIDLRTDLMPESPRVLRCRGEDEAKSCSVISSCWDEASLEDEATV